VKTLSVCVLLSLLSTVAFIGFSSALSGAGRSLTQVAAAPAIAPTPSSPNSRVSALTLDVLASRTVSGAPRDDSDHSARFSTYVSLHKAWSEDHAAPTARPLNVCSE